ncbi:alpha/beta hydrolase family protein [Lentiprolixibacter aurantiacus]|uniref:Prolyl oligopeptidase family serine peptidase n=1 Tax=Lentiprolixibacter aurantiacus TaxID=2993939 RepID=A0AAE3MLU6_9FLAO|nr:prolyl oligopeptidase family serine peptidase [Lentiprolixibacter aurantiacus]MCX2719824.1 prolyl oligopeptidase family serine peptidase [Lentiprolixibacter aurantiacus]
MKKLFGLLLASILLLSCSGTENTKDIEGKFTGDFNYGNFSDNISFEIDKDSTAWRVSFSSLEQNAIQIPARNVVSIGDSINFILQSDQYTYTFKNKWHAKEASLTGSLTVDTLTVNYNLKKELDAEAHKVQSQDIVFQSNGLLLSGTIWKPGNANNKALVFVTSSGPGDRSGSRAEAIYFAQKGYTTFHYDKRGTGISQGDWYTATMDELVMDDVNAIKYFTKKTNIPISQIGIKGSSQGATKVPKILGELEELRFGIAVSCPGSSLLESDLNYWKNRNREILGDNLEAASLFQKQVFQHIAGTVSRADLEKSIQTKKSAPWFSSVWVPNLDEITIDEKLLFNPLPYFEKIKQPVLIIQGMADEIIPPNSHKLISVALEKANNEDFKLVILKGANHSMHHTGKTDFPYWAKLHDDYLDSMASWLEMIRD